MAIIICPECGGKVTTTRSNCFHCGWIIPKTKKCPECEEDISYFDIICQVCGYEFEKENKNTLVKKENEIITDNKVEEIKTDNKAEKIKKDSEINNGLDDLKELLAEIKEVENKIKEIDVLKFKTTVSNEEVEESCDSFVDTSNSNIIGSISNEVEEEVDDHFVENSSSINIENTSNNNAVYSSNVIEEKDSCPYCQSKEEMLIGLNYYMCIECKMKYFGFNNKNENLIIERKETTIASVEKVELINNNEEKIDNFKDETTCLKEDDNVETQERKEEPIAVVEVLDTNKETIDTSEEEIAFLKEDDNVETQERKEETIDTSKEEIACVEEIVKEKLEKTKNLFKKILFKIKNLNKKTKIIASVSLAVALLIGIFGVIEIASFSKYEMDFTTVMEVKDKKIEKANIPYGVTGIYPFAFSGCKNLESVKIPSSVKGIGYNAFYNCTSLTSITIPNGVTSIDTQTFKGCKNLTIVTIPKSVTYIGYEAFSGCTGLTIIYKGTWNEWADIYKYTGWGSGSSLSVTCIG